MNPMIGEIPVLGMLVPRILIWMLLAVALGALVRRVMGLFNLYRFIWHPALFDMAVTVIVFGALIAVLWGVG